MSQKLVEFTLGTDPQVYSLCYDFNQLADAESLTGQNLNASYLGGEVTVSQLRGILYAFLRTKHAVTLKEAGSLMATAEGRKKCLRAISDLLNEEMKEDPKPITEVPLNETASEAA